MFLSYAPPPGKARERGVDLARGIASLIMIQGHAYHGWVATESKATLAYGFTRVLGTFPLPAFLVLAGSTIVLRVRAAIARGEAASSVRRALLKRALQLLAAGYALNLASAGLDGHEGLVTFLRADVLHVIGLSIGLVAIAGIGGEQVPPSIERLVGASGVIGVAVTLACPFATALSRHTSLPVGYVLGLFVEVPGVTRMPLVPLFAWCALGIAATAWLTMHAPREPRLRRPIELLSLALGCIAIGQLGVWAALRLVHGPFDRAHPAVIANVVELGGRGVVILCAGVLLSRWLEHVGREDRLEPLAVLGRGSLVAYMFHVPFCYGALGRAIVGKLDMPVATLFVLLLMAASYGAVLAWNATRKRA